MIIDCLPQSHPPSGARLVLMSGLSDPQSCHLTEEQRAFLADVAPVGMDVLPLNFPYLDGTPAVRRRSLLAASLANTSQFLAMAAGPRQQAALRHWDSLLASTAHLTVVTLSCGLEILNQCAAMSPPEIPVFVMALGPVARSTPTLPTLLVGGARDVVSRWFFPRCDHVLPGLGHMGYIRDSRVRDLVRAFLCSSTSS